MDKSSKKKSIWQVFKDSGKGAKILIFICLGLFLMFAYSYSVNTEEHAATLEDLLVVTDGTIKPENEGKLVLATGTPYIENDGILRDEEMGITVENAVSYSRVPYEKIYYIEVTTTVLKHDLNDPNDDETKVNKRLTTVWEDMDEEWPMQLKHDGKTYQNPEKLDYHSFYANNYLLVGDFKLLPNQFGSVVQTKPFTISEDQLLSSTKDWLDSATGQGFTVERLSNGGGRLSNGDAIGSVHIACEYSVLDKTAPLTVIGKQEGDRIVTYDLNGFDEFYVYSGEITKEDFINDVSETDSGDRTACVIVMVISVLVIVGCLAVERKMQ